MLEEEDGKWGSGMEKPAHKKDSWRQEKEIRRGLRVFFQTWNSLEPKQRGQVRGRRISTVKTTTHC